MLAIEAIWPAREFPKIRWWRLVGFGFLAVIIGLGVVTPLLLPVEWLAQHRVLDGTPPRRRGRRDRRAAR